jgi:hypothetical protein
MANVGRYIYDLADNWAAFLTGGIPAALLLIYERVRGEQLSLRTFAILLAVGFVIASYRAHDRLFGELKKTDQVNSGLTSELKATRDELAETRRQLIDARKWIPTPSSTAQAPPPRRAGPTITNMKTTGTQGVGIYMEGNPEGLNINGYESTGTKGTDIYLAGQRTR